jgi:histidyl-tRNA synthetase
MAFERPRGVRDFGPEEMGVRAYVEDAMSAVFRSFSYRRIQTPTFEFLDLFSLKSGEEITEHLFVLEDKGGRKMCLRPEATASVARMYVSELRSRPKPLRLCYFGPMFRHEEPQKGRYREFWQAGVELIGLTGAYADAEIVSMASECLRRLGLAYTLRISHIGVLRALLAGLGFPDAEQDLIIRALDKGDLETVKAKVQDETFNAVIGLRGGLDAAVSASKIVKEAGTRQMLDGLVKTLRLLDGSGIRYEVDFGMARGLDYYTGLVFDARVEGLGAQNQVLGGGRYDDLIGLFGGQDTPAVGFAFGVDRLIESMQEQGVELPPLRTDVYVIPVSADLLDAALGIALKLRRLHPEKIVDLDISGRRLNKALQHASELNARHAVLVGPLELKEESVIVKDMVGKTQSKVRISEISGLLG